MTDRKSKSFPFPLEKILTISAREYCESKGKNLSDYEMFGVHAQGYDIRAVSEIFCNQAGNAEVVVNYQFIRHSVPTKNTKQQETEQEIMIAAGTALIPKKRK